LAEREEKTKTAKKRLIEKFIAENEDEKESHYTPGKNPVGLQLSPDGRYALFSKIQTETISLQSSRSW